MITEIRVRGYVLSTADGSVLANRTKSGLRLFGGRVKASETIRSALKRELREELGIEADVGALMSVEEKYKGRGKRQRRVVEITFLVRANRGLMLVPEAGMHPEWVSASDLGMRLGERLA